MKEKIRIFLDSDLLEKYVLGATDAQESLRVERYIAMYPEVRKTYGELQENLESFARLYARPAPEGLKDRILGQIKSESKGKRYVARYAVAASVAIIFLAAASYSLWHQNQDLQEQNVVVKNEIRSLEKNMQSQLEDLRNQFIVKNNPQTKKYAVRGNKRAKELKAVAYINPVKKLSYINVRKLPDLPKDQCFQMWAEVNGEMVNLGVIKEVGRDKLLAMPYAEKAISYITIEPEGGNAVPSVENMVAKIDY